MHTRRGQRPVRCCSTPACFVSLLQSHTLPRRTLSPIRPPPPPPLPLLSPQVWHASLAENFNVSIPWIQISKVHVRSSKFGQALVVETVARAGGYVLGFKIEPDER